MKNLTRAALLSTVILSGFVQAAEPVQATQIDAQELQNAAHAYLGQSLTLVSISEVQLDASSLLAGATKPAKANEKELVASNRLVAE